MKACSYHVLTKQTSMAGSSQVRTVIELFCKILEENHLCVIRAETLRQAKFNKESASEPLWKLLFNVVCFCSSDTLCSKYPPMRFQVLKEEEVAFVKCELQKLGYLNQSFARLPHDFSSGSRELLLALGWMIHTHMLFDKITAARSNPLQQELTKFLHPEGPLSDSESQPLPRSGNRNLSPKEQIQRQLMLCGKLRLYLRRLYMVHQELAGLKFTIRKSTDGISLLPDHNHLSPLEVHLLRYPDSLKKMIDELERDNGQLKNLLDWRDKEHVFWEWMDSVLNLHIQEKSYNNPSAVEDVYLPIPHGMGKEITLARAKLRDFILQHEADIEKMEQLILRKKVSHVEVEVLKHHLDTEISQLAQRLQDCGRGWKWNSDNHESKICAEGNTHLDSPAQTSLHPQHNPKSKYVPRSMQAIRAAKQTCVLENAENEISKLERTVHQLELELRQLEKENTIKLHCVIEKDASLICIQPRYCKQFFMTAD